MIVGERSIQITVAVLVLVGSLLLSIAQNSATIIALTTVVVVWTVLVIDIQKRVSFHPAIVNILAFVVSLVSIGQFMGGDASSKLSAVANLLTYLQLVLLLQKKTPRLYWQVMMLSLLQVVVAAALNLDFNAGLVFMVYMVLTVVAMIHLNRYRHELRRYEAAEKGDKHIDQIQTRRYSSSIAMVFRDRIASKKRSYVGHGLLLACVGLIFAFVVFFSIPRFDSAWYGPNISQKQVTGFSSEVRFDDDGFLKQSNELVMRVSFLDSQDEPIRLAVEPYFRGLTLSRFSKRGGVWTWSTLDKTTRGRREGGDRLGTAKFPRSSDLAFMKQQIKLERAAQFKPNRDSEDHLAFSVFPVFRSPQTPGDLLYDRNSQILFRDATATSQSLNGPYKYEIITPFYRNLGQVPATPITPSYFETFRPDEANIMLLGIRNELFSADWKPIQELSNQITEQAGERGNRRLVCSAMVNHLKRSEYSYTRALNTIQRDKSIDPIVDFLINHKSGHCEYFASALALMLRSQGIPCRLVSGFRGGDYNELGGFYEVREKHAHTWVEAKLLPSDCEDTDMLETGQASEFGAWLRLDATPSANFRTTGSSGRNLVDQAGDAIGFVQQLWDDYVMGLDSSSRKSNGFDPTDESKSWFNGEYARDKIDSILQNAKSVHWAYYVLIIGGVLLINMAYNYFRVKASHASDGKSKSRFRFLMQLLAESCKSFVKPHLVLRDALFRRNTISDGSEVNFYKRFTTMLQTHGFQRKANQTQKEFGDEIIGLLIQDQDEIMSQTITSAIQTITNGFYKARFDDSKLDPNDRAQIESELEKLENAISQK